MNAFTIIELLLTQLAAGLAAGMLLVPRRETGPGFFLTGSLIVAGLLGVVLGARLAALSNAPGWQVSLLAGCAALALLHGWLTRLEKRDVTWARRAGPAILVFASLAGLAAVAAPALGLSEATARAGAPAVSAGTLALALNFLAGAGVLGLTGVSLLFGHWYLILHGMSFGPLKRLVALTGGACALRAGLLIVEGLRRGDAWLESHYRAGGDAFTYLLAIVRGGCGFLLAPLLLFMVWGCLAAKNNQSATGILYAMMVMVLIGEATARYFLVMMGIPL